MDAAYNLARYLSRDPIAAEDVVQEAFLRALRAFRTYRGEAAKPWLLAIVRNCFHDWGKANRDRRGISEEEEDGRYGAPGRPIDDIHLDHDTPEVILLRRREVEMVRTTLENLPEPFREALVLRELEDLSYKEIALLTEVPIGTVMSRLARARQMLGEMLLPRVESGRKAQP